MNSTKLAIHGGPAEMDGLPELPAWPQSSQATEDAVVDVLRSGVWGSSHGTTVKTFEERFAAHHNAKHGVAMTNGTMAIVAALRAAGIGLGDEVIVPPYTFIATASAALFVGAIPVFADVDPTTHLLDPKAAEAAITERTRAIIPVHLAGNVADMTAFSQLGAERNLVIIEDAAQAAGASWEGQGVGSLGHMGTFSFQSSKNMTAGEGGLVLTNDDALADALYSVVNVGRVRGGGWYQHEHVGFNLRLTEFQGAILNTQLDDFEHMQALRTRNAERLTRHLQEVDGVQVDYCDPRVTAHGQHLFIFRVPELGAQGRRDEVAGALRAEGVDRVSPGYVPLQHNEAVRRETAALCKRLGQSVPDADCPNTDLVTADTLWFPHAYLMGSEEQTDAISRAIAKVVRALT